MNEASANCQVAEVAGVTFSDSDSEPVTFSGVTFSDSDSEPKFLNPGFTHVFT